jgi:hypothetical protein
MTVLAAHRSGWWWASWHAGGFLDAVARGMKDAGREPDLWRVAGRPVAAIPECNPKWSLLSGRLGQFGQHRGHFMWDGADMGVSREAAGSHLARYLNAIYRVAPADPIRIIAHSHGCNVVKRASADKRLDPAIHVRQAVFLACPHFGGSDRATFSYRLAPARFGAVLNLYSRTDSVQTSIADAVKGVPSARIVEHMPQASHRTDRDPASTRLYADFEIPTADQGVAAHSALHGATVGYLVGRWLAGQDFAGLLRAFRAKLLPVPEGDHGA